MICQGASMRSHRAVNTGKYQEIASDAERNKFLAWPPGISYRGALPWLRLHRHLIPSYSRTSKVSLAAA